MSTATMEAPKSIWAANRYGQWAFLCCPHWEVLAHGDRGGGKTTALLVSFLSHVGKGYGADWRGVIFRLTYPQLKDVVDMSRSLIPRAYPGAKFNKVEHEWTFEDGETLLFRPLENLKAYDNHHGHAYSMLGFEELCAWPNSEPYEAMLSCSRKRSARAEIPTIVRSTTNSWGVGHQWVKSRFVQGKRAGYAYGELGRERVHIPILWQDNEKFVAADPDYHARLADTITNEAQRKAWLENSWDIVAGGRFSESWLESVHVMEPFNIPQAWRIDRSHDWGSSSPYCTLWYAESNGEAIEDGRSWPRGTLFVIHEDYGCQGDMYAPNWKPNVGIGLSPIEIGQKVKQHEADMREWGLIKRQPQPGPADDPMFDVTRGQSMASIMSQLGVIWMRPSKGPGSRVTGWQILEDKLRASLKHPMEAPGLFIFDTCKHLIRTLPIAQRDPKKPEDIDMDEDHALDSLRLRLLAYVSSDVIRGVSL